MTICPIAIVASCKQCPAFKLCPLKGMLGDYKPVAPVSNGTTSKKKSKKAK